MRLIVLGAGAIGGAIAARVAIAGGDVAVVARGAHLDAIRAGGLRLETPEESFVVPLAAAADPSELRIDDDDVVLLAVKSQDTAAALDGLRACAPESTPIVCAQNGVANEAMALRRFPFVYGMCVMCPATHLEPGVVQASSTPVTGLMDVGRWPSGTDELSDALAATLSASSFSSVSRDDISRWKWGKLLLNLGNAVEALCGRDPQSAQLVELARNEGVACLEAAGVEFVGPDEDAARREGILTPKPIAGTRRGGGSTWQSLTRSLGSVETDYLTGEVVLLGRLCGVATPVSELLQRLVYDAARAHTPPGSRSAAEVLELLSTPRAG